MFHPNYCGVIKMNELPLGFGMALSMNQEAMKKFSSLSEEERKEVVRRTRTIESKREMHDFVENLAKSNFS